MYNYHNQKDLTLESVVKYPYQVEIVPFHQGAGLDKEKHQMVNEQDYDLVDPVQMLSWNR